MSFFDILKTVLPLIFLLGFLYLVLYLVKKYSFSFRKKNIKMLNVKVLATQMILPKKFISIIKVQDKLLVLGISDASITLLKELDSTDEIDQEQSAADSDVKLDFKDIFKKNLGIK
ncbi:MAG: flagellar biosynthetic protein FliO [Ignavibacteriales bacterium]|nr:MAG: flagellar biosynthetic protein FliO [Ignavibacteriales bacterium]